MGWPSETRLLPCMCVSYLVHVTLRLGLARSRDSGSVPSSERRSVRLACLCTLALRASFQLTGDDQSITVAQHIGQNPKARECVCSALLARVNTHQASPWISFSEDIAVAYYFAVAQALVVFFCLRLRVCRCMFADLQASPGDTHVILGVQAADVAWFRMTEDALLGGGSCRKSLVTAAEPGHRGSSPGWQLAVAFVLAAKEGLPRTTRANASCEPCPFVQARFTEWRKKFCFWTCQFTSRTGSTSRAHSPGWRLRAAVRLAAVLANFPRRSS